MEPGNNVQPQCPEPTFAAPWRPSVNKQPYKNSQYDTVSEEKHPKKSSNSNSNESEATHNRLPKLESVKNPYLPVHMSTPDKLSTKENPESQPASKTEAASHKSDSKSLETTKPYDTVKSEDAKKSVDSGGEIHDLKKPNKLLQVFLPKGKKKISKGEK